MLRVAERMEHQLVLRQTVAGHIHACCIPPGSLFWPRWQPAFQPMLLATEDITDLAKKSEVCNEHLQ